MSELITTNHKEFTPVVNKDYLVELTSSETSQMEELILSLPQFENGRVPDEPDFFDTLKEASNNIPSRLAEELQRFKEESNVWGTIVLRGLPVDRNLPPTPGDGKRVHKPTSMSEYGLMLSMTQLGEHYSDIREKNGDIIHQISPIKGKEKAQENGGSDAFFELHSENVFLPRGMTPRHLGLTCIRPGYNGGAPTMTMSIHNALPYLDQHVVQALSADVYRFRFASSYGAQERWTEPRPVLTIGSNGRLEMTVDFADMAAEVPEGVTALDSLREALLLPENTLTHHWQPGDAVIVENMSAVHARKGFTALYDGNDRWLQRGFTLSPEDFQATANWRPQGSHVFQTNQ